jgi:hypothetical protein
MYLHPGEPDQRDLNDKIDLRVEPVVSGETSVKE